MIVLIVQVLLRLTRFVGIQMEPMLLLQIKTTKFV
jgi:hypothetical protein